MVVFASVAGHKRFLAQAVLHATPEVAFGMHSWSLLILPTFSLPLAQAALPAYLVSSRMKTATR